MSDNPEPRHDRRASDLPALYRPASLTTPGALHTGPAGDDDSGSQLLQRYLSALVRRKWVFLAVVATVFALSVLDLYTTTPLYRASARLQIDPEEMNVLPYQDFSDTQAYLSYQYQETQLEKLRSRELAERVARRLDLAENPDFWAPAQAGVVSRLKANVMSLPWRLFGMIRLALSQPPSGGAGTEPANPAAEASSEPEDPSQPYPYVGSLQGGIRAAPVGQTRLIEISYTSPVPEFAAKVADTVAEEFVKLHLESRYRSTARATEFLQEELEELKIRVERSQEELFAYARQKNIVNLTERETLNRKKLADLTDQLTQAETALFSLQATVRGIENSATGEYPEAMKDERILDLEARLSAARSELAALANGYGPEFPRVKALNEKVRELEAQLEESRQRAIGSARRDYAIARDRYERLSAAVAEQKLLVEQLDDDSIQYNILKREVETNQQLYEGLLQRLKEAGVAAGLESSNIQVSERAVVPGGPSYPQRGRAQSRALMMGLLLGILAVFGLEVFDKSVKDVEDVQQFAGLPSLGVVPRLDLSSNGHGRRWFPMKRGDDQPRPILAAHGVEGLRGPAWEAYRSLRTSLLLAHSGSPPRAILVTSPGPGEGKTTTAANLALALAMTGERTLLIDLDLRKPALADSFEVASDMGMSTFLSGNSDFSSLIWQTQYKKLYLVAAGPPPPNPPELIGSERMAKAVQLMRNHFTYVVVDSPPALALSDAFVASSHLDGVVIVARAGKTNKQALRKAGQNFQQLGSRVFGVVLNEVSPQRFDYGYMYGTYGEDVQPLPRKVEIESSKKSA